jgi:hypothetical protein
MKNDALADIRYTNGYVARSDTSVTTHVVSVGYVIPSAS